MATAVGLFYYAFWRNTAPFVQEANEDDSHQNETTNSSQNNNKPQKQTEADTLKQSNTNSDRANAPKYDDTNKLYTVGVSASSDEDESVVYIRGMISTTVSGGACYVTAFSPSGHTVTKQTEVLASPANSYCKTIQLPKSSLEKGTWKYTLNYKSDNARGSSSENTFTIK